MHNLIAIAIGECGKIVIHYAFCVYNPICFGRWPIVDDDFMFVKCDLGGTACVV